nr:PilW family protein [Gammaproteobacteria bacterium]
GCLDVNSGALEIRANAAPTANIRDTATTGSVVVTSNTWVPAPPIGFAEPTATPAIPATHVLSLQFAGSTRGVLNDQLNDGISPTPAGDIVLDSNEPDPGLQNNDLAIISNCDFGDLFRVSNVGTNSGNIVIEHGAAVNSSGALTRAYGAPATIDQTIVAKFHSNIYFVADTGLTNNDGDPITALYQQSLPYDPVNNPPTQLVLGVENMRIAFGIRDNTDTLSYVTPDSAAFVPGDVESIRIGLLMVSWDRMASTEDTTTYILAGQPIPASAASNDGNTHPQDLRFRLAFNATIKVRNRRNNL